MLHRILLTVALMVFVASTASAERRGFIRPYSYGYRLPNPYPYRPYYPYYPRVYNNYYYAPNITNSFNTYSGPVNENITLHLPDMNSKVTINGVDFPGFGTTRTVTVNDIKPGQHHEFKVKVDWNSSGKPKSVEKTVTLDGSGHASLLIPE
ncbi:hypothetical protein BH11PLA2_BH11PLA2_48200 [soil metagenome]